MCNSLFGGNNCTWIIILAVIYFCCCGNEGTPTSGCGCNNECGGCC